MAEDAGALHDRRGAEARTEARVAHLVDDRGGVDRAIRLVVPVGVERDRVLEDKGHGAGQPRETIQHAGEAAGDAVDEPLRLIRAAFRTALPAAGKHVAQWTRQEESRLHAVADVRAI